MLNLRSNSLFYCGKLISLRSLARYTKTAIVMLIWCDSCSTIKLEPARFQDGLRKSDISTNSIFIANFNKCFSNLIDVLCIRILFFYKCRHFLCRNIRGSHNIHMTCVIYNWRSQVLVVLL